MVSYSVIPHYPGTKAISEYHLTILPSLNSCSNIHTESTTSLPNKEKVYRLRPNSYLPNAILNQPYSIMVSTSKDDAIQNIFSSYSWLQFKLTQNASRNIYQLYGTPTILGNAEISLSSPWLANIHMNIYPSAKSACYTPTPPIQTTTRYFDSHE